MRHVRRQQSHYCNRSGAGAAALAVKKETPVAVAQETREAAALICVAAEGSDHRGLLPTPAQRAAGRGIGRRDGGGAGGVAAQ